jgi:hypothetical protein
LLNAVTRILATNSIKPNIQEWPLLESSSPYKWLYQLNSLDLADHLVNVPIGGEAIQIPDLIQVCTEYLNDVASRYLGEFYTPLSIAEHLVELSRWCPEHVLNQCSIIDPACGGGIILWLIEKRFLQAALTEGLDVDLGADLLSKSIYGYDIQPFAVTLTRTILFSEFLRAYPEFCRSSEHFLPNIRLQDALITYENHWREFESCGFFEDTKRFDFIIANPPYMAFKKNQLY